MTQNRSDVVAAAGGAAQNLSVRPEALRVPVIVAPMFLVSGPDLVVASLAEFGTLLRESRRQPISA